MDENNFFHTFDKIDDEFIEEAAGNGAVKPDFANPPPKSRKPVFAILGAAACFALVFSIGMAVKNNTGIEITQPPVNSAETTSETASETSTEEPETTPAETEPEGVEITDESGTTFTLHGMLSYTDNLRDFDYEKNYQIAISRDSEAMRFFNSLDIPDKEEITELYFRGSTLCNIIDDGTQLIGGDYSLLGNAQIAVPTGDYFIVYFESGISFESYLNALSEVFAEDAVKALIDSPRSFVCPLDYNGEMWIQGGEYPANLDLRHEEYFLTKSTDTEFEFTTIQYFGSGFWEVEAAADDLSDLNDWYMVSTVENAFIKTENGWRIKEICTEYGPLADESYNMENNISQYLSLEDRYYNEGTVMPLPSNWTEEAAKAAWKRFYMAELNKTIDERTAYYSNGNYLDRVFFDFNGDGRAEIMFTDPYGNIYILDDNQEILLRRSHPWSREIYVPTAVTDSKELERMGSDYEENESIYKSRELKILTDKNGKFYFITAYYDLNHWKYYLYELSKEKKTVVPVYKWGEFPVQSEGKLVYQTKYIKFTDNPENPQEEITEQELEALISVLTPAK